jgi:hypothetical protein
MKSDVTEERAQSRVLRTPEGIFRFHVSGEFFDYPTDYGSNVSQLNNNTTTNNNMTASVV